MSTVDYNVKTFQGMILTLQNFWAQHGCVILQPLDLEMGAATFHRAIFLRAIGIDPLILLAERCAGLKNVLFQAKFGNLFEKS